MIEAICDLMKKAGAEQVQLNIKLTNNGAQVVLNTKLHPHASNDLTATLNKMTESDRQVNLNLRTALSRPLVAQGSIAELDINFADYVVQYTDSYIPVANSFCNLTDNKAALDAVNSVDASSVKGASKAATQATSKIPEFEEEDFNEDAESL